MLLTEGQGPPHDVISECGSRGSHRERKVSCIETERTFNRPSLLPECESPSPQATSSDARQIARHALDQCRRGRTSRRPDNTRSLASGGACVFGPAETGGNPLLWLSFFSRWDNPQCPRLWQV